MNLKIAWLYPDLMSTYGDRGNIICLKKRCEWRGIEAEVSEIEINNEVSQLKECNLLFMGGAQDRQQKIAADDLIRNKGTVLKEMVVSGVPGLFICGAYQFLGKYYKPAEGEKIKGLGIFDLYTEHPGIDKERCIGNIVVEAGSYNSLLISGKSNYLVGFENHGGRTYLGKGIKPLGKVIKGYGNNGQDQTEGCIYINSIGTYLHGPILPKNPHLADFLIKKALYNKYKKEIELKPLDDSLEWQANESMVKRIL